MPRWYSRIARRAQTLLAASLRASEPAAADRLAAVQARARNLGMHYHRRAPDLRTDLPGPAFAHGGIAQHLFTLAPGRATGRGLTWFEFAAHPDAQPGFDTVQPVHTVVMLDCPISDPLDSPAGRAQLEAATYMAHAVEIADLFVHETPRGLLASAPGALTLPRCEAMTALLRHLAANL
ncbi:hypothetical protein JT358_07480 [Micrococcales bacterium 31B]|nr:hypothetical protein [Micrococcales bacterium 31B]